VASASVSSGKGTRSIIAPVIHAPVNDRATAAEATAIAAADGGTVNKSKDEGAVPPSKKSGKKKQQVKDISGKISEGNKDGSVAKKKAGRK
jgi:hypothetical protein